MFFGIISHFFIFPLDIRAADLVPISFEGGETPMDVSPVKEQLVFGSRNEIRLRRSMNSFESTMDECCKKDDPQCFKYKGSKSTTISGKKCQGWNQQSPHKHGLKEFYFHAGDFETNYCRNPDGLVGGAWCYTMDKNTEREYCGIPTCQAQDVDDCIPDPCYFGKCTDGVNSYTCQCKPGYTGKNCNLDIDECLPKPCYHGTCYNGENSYMCQCAPGYKGKNCDKEATTAAVTTALTTPSKSTSPPTGNKSHIVADGDSGENDGGHLQRIAVIVMTVLVLIVISITVGVKIYFVIRNKRRRKKESEELQRYSQTQEGAIDGAIGGGANGTAIGGGANGTAIGGGANGNAIGGGANGTAIGGGANGAVIGENTNRATTGDTTGDAIGDDEPLIPAGGDLAGLTRSSVHIAIEKNKSWTVQYKHSAESYTCDSLSDSFSDSSSDSSSDSKTIETMTYTLETSSSSPVTTVETQETSKSSSPK